MRTCPNAKTLAAAIIVGFLLVPVLSGIGAPTSEDSEVRHLLKERLATTAKIYDMSKASFEAGQIGPGEMLQAQAALLRAKLAVCDTKDDRVKVHGEMVEAAKQMMELIQAQAETGSVPQIEVLKAQAQLLDVRIGLERAKAE
jgi:outer membrane protein TolC